MKIDVLASEPQFVDHLAPVYQALPEAARGDFIVWRSPHTRLSPAELIVRGVERRIFATTKIEDSTRPILVTSWGDHKKARTMGRTRIARMEHGIGQSFAGSDHESYAGGRDADDVSLFLVPNEYSAARWQGAYPDARVVIVGSPKLDALPSRASGPRPVVAISFHWNSGPRTGPLVETNGSFPEYRRILGDLAREFPMIGHGHPRLLPSIGPIYRRFGIPVVDDFADVCLQADVYVCDTNSTLYEFAATGRPVVVVNGSHFRRDVVHGLRFDWGACTGVGVQCDAPSDLVAAIREALEDRPEQRRARETALDIAYARRSGGASRAASVLLEWALATEAVAA